MGGHALTGVDGFRKRTDMFYVDPRTIVVKDGWNTRTDFSREEELMASIVENGVRKPLLVRKVVEGDGKRIELVDGERRIRATLRAISEGVDIQSVPVMVAQKGASDLDLLIDSIISNDGKPPTPTEEAEGYRRLKNYGMTVRDIARKVGKSDSHIRNRLELASASPEVRAAVEQKEIPISEAQEIAKNPSIEKQSEALQKRKIAPRAKRLVFSYRNGSVQQTGIKGRSCGPILEILQSDSFKTRLSDNGFDPNTIKITIQPTEE